MLGEMLMVLSSLSTEWKGRKFRSERAAALRAMEIARCLMSENYQAKLNSYVAGKDALQMQAETPQLLAALVKGVPEARLGQRPGHRSAADRSDNEASPQYWSAWAASARTRRAAGRLQRSMA